MSRIRYWVGCVLLLTSLGLLSWLHIEREQALACSEERNRQLESALELQQRQLADTSHELWTQLSQQQRALADVRRLLGAPSHRPVLASRGGHRLRGLAGLRQALEGQHADLARLSLEARAFLRTLPRGAPCVGEMTSGFGGRLHPIYGTGRFHKGCDFTTDFGTPIRATADGVVIRSDWLGGYGQVVEIRHPGGLTTLYAHCSELLVSKGARVRQGDCIARVGQTGLASGPHCHYEVHRGETALNPARYL